MYQELSQQQYQELRDTAEQSALQLRREALQGAPEALCRHVARAGRSAWRCAAWLVRHLKQRVPVGTTASSLRAKD